MMEAKMKEIPAVEKAQKKVGGHMHHACTLTYFVTHRYATSISSGHSRVSSSSTSNQHEKNSPRSGPNSVEVPVVRRQMPLRIKWKAHSIYQYIECSHAHTHLFFLGCVQAMDKSFTLSDSYFHNCLMVSLQATLIILLKPWNSSLELFQAEN